MMRWEHGDLLVFSGSSCVSWGIRLATLSRWSHVGAVVYVSRDRLDEVARRDFYQSITAETVSSWRDCWLLIESTTLATTPCRITGQRIKGVQAHRPLTRVMHYRGRVSLLRLTDRWRMHLASSQMWSRGLIGEIGVEYDGRGAMLAGTKVIKRLWWARPADMSSVFCSELIAYWESMLGRLPKGNPATYSPAALVKALVERHVYHPPQPLQLGSSEENLAA